MDIRMPGMDGLAATEIVRGRDRAPEVIVLTTFDADDHVLRALRAGASGFLLKDTSPAEVSPSAPNAGVRCRDRRVNLRVDPGYQPGLPPEG
jgi:DNA-binding NarL/FixJ family response regulator